MIKYTLIQALCLYILTCLLPFNTAQAVTLGSEEGTTTVPSTLAEDDVEQYVAPLSDTEAREALIQTLQQQAQQQQNQLATTETTSVLEMVMRPESDPSSLTYRLSEIRQQLGSLPNDFEQILSTSAFDTACILVIIMMILVGWFVERILLIKLVRFSQQLSSETGTSWHAKLGFLFMRLFTDMLQLLGFVAGAFLVIKLMTEDGNPQAMLTLAVLALIASTRVVSLLSRFFLSPEAEGLRLLPTDNTRSVRYLHFCIVSFYGLFFAIEYFLVFIAQNGIQGDPLLFVTIIASIPLDMMVIYLIWNHRHDINQIYASVHQYQKPSRLVHFIARLWPLIFTILLLTMRNIWWINLVLDNHDRISAVTLSWWICFSFPVVDLLVGGLLRKIASNRANSDRRFKNRSQRFVNVIQTTVRIVLLTTMLLALMQAWGVSAITTLNTHAGRAVIEALFNVGSIIIVAYILWEFIEAAIERHLPEEEEQPNQELEGEGGGAAATRKETILPLLRMFILTTLVVVVTLTVLHALGVEITPLLAGAGVIGLAVGFGSQKLVQDIISGIFFLLDDAFRKGEYLEAAGARGTVEKISIRSMQLRHHLGAVQTIPYSTIDIIKNMSRDWVTMKLEFRLPYDVDIERVRKIIKKEGLKMMDDEVLGPSMLMPLKSQGIIRIEESALILRMKFTTLPGEQWIVRREAYRRVKEALESNDIYFAHRKVTVVSSDHLEPKQIKKEEHSIDPSAALAVTGAAVTTAMISDELKKQGKIDETGPAEDEQM